MLSVYTQKRVLIFMLGLFLAQWPVMGRCESTIQPSIAPPIITFEHFSFNTVPEGTVLSHEFVLQNHGRIALEIFKVSTSCSCVRLESHDKVIDPGKSGRISVKVDTRGYGGKVLQRKVIALTSNKEMPRIIMNITGDVDKVYSLTPEVVKLVGKTGESIEQIVTLIPEDKYPFKITGIRAKRGDYIIYRIDEFEQNHKTGYHVLVTNIKKDAGRYFDKLYLSTDNKMFPEIHVGVFADIKTTS